MKKLICILGLLFSLSSQASVEVAFLELRTYSGELVQLEPGGKFAHIAIRYHDAWLHAYPYRGVEVVSEEKLKRIGTIKEIIAVSGLESLDENRVKYFLGKPYDLNFSWNDDEIYCSELIAKLLNIPPMPMRFDAAMWADAYQDKKGSLGISPDEIFEFLKSRQKSPKVQWNIETSPTHGPLDVLDLGFETRDYGPAEMP